MQYSAGLVLALALVAAPVFVRAEEAPQEESAVEEPRRHPRDRREPPQPPALEAETPALELKLDDAGVRVAPGSARADYLREQLRRSRVALGVSTVFFVGGVAMMAASFANIERVFCISFGGPCARTPSWVTPVAVVGALLIWA